MRLSKMDGWLFFIGLVAIFFLVLVADVGPRQSLPVLYLFLLVLLSSFSIFILYLSMTTDIESVLKFIGI